MKRKIIALTLALMLLVPALAVAEGATLPFGLALGMDGEQARAAFAADPTLAKLTPDKSDYGSGAVEYVFEDVAIPGTSLTANSLSVQIDQNNSKTAEHRGLYHRPRGGQHRFLPRDLGRAQPHAGRAGGRSL